MTRGGERRFRELIARRERGEPVAYLRGFKEFYGLQFVVDPRVLIPRPESETLVEAAREVIAGRAVTVVDVGTGSGALAIAIAFHEPKARVIATEISADALAVARANAVANGVADRVDFREGDLLAPVRDTVEVVVANLPYLRQDALSELVGERTSLAFEPAIAVTAGADGVELIRRAAADVPRVLARDGSVFFEVDPPIADRVVDIVRDFIGGEPRVIRDLAGDARVVATTR
jgi:release factor glutamine methyltransferase